MHNRWSARRRRLVASGLLLRRILRINELWSQESKAVMSSTQPIAVVFPGQGSQKPGMAQDLINVAPEMYELRMSVASDILGWDISRMCVEGTSDELRKTSITQPVVFAVSALLWEVLRDSGIKPKVVAGHSLGEYGALFACGALSFEDAIHLVGLRGRLMEEVGMSAGGMMAVIGASINHLECVCSEASSDGYSVEIANDNGGGQVVLSGSHDGLTVARKLVSADRNVRCISLPVGAPFHCSLMSPIAEEFGKTIDTITFQDPSLPYIANTTAKLINSGNSIGELLVDQITGRVRWRETLHTMQEIGIATQIECGPGRVLSSLARKEAGITMDIRSTDDGIKELIESMNSSVQRS